jgi:putative transposase
VHHSDRGRQGATPTGPTLPAPCARSAARATATTAAAESLIGLFKTELIRRRSPWKGLDDVELATLEYVDWFNHRRLNSACGNVPPVEFENAHYRSIAALTPEVPAQPSLH